MHRGDRPHKCHKRPSPYERPPEHEHEPESLPERFLLPDPMRRDLVKFSEQHLPTCLFILKRGLLVGNSSPLRGQPSHQVESTFCELRLVTYQPASPLQPRASKSSPIKVEPFVSFAYVALSRGPYTIRHRNRIFNSNKRTPLATSLS